MIGLLLAAAVAVSPIDAILATRQALLSDLAKRSDAPVVLKETGVNAVDLEIRKLADGKRVVWQGTKTLEAKAPDGVSPAVHPVSRISGADFGVHDWWLCRIADKRREVAALKGGQVDLVMLGDSITHFWETQGKDALAELRKTYTVLDLGYRGDRTGHLLWRVLNGELDGYKAKCITLMIGTNNCGFTPADETAAAIREILAVIARKQPQAKVLLMPVFPRGASAKDGGRLVNDKVNELIRPCADDRRVIWFNVGSRFIDAKGDVAKYMLPDRLHPNAEGYRLWLEAFYRELPPICGGEKEITPGKRISPDGKTVWWNAKTLVPMEGQCWTDVEKPYDRLPARAKGRVTTGVWGRQRDTAGLCLRFTTSAKALKVRWSLTSETIALGHMPASGVSGLDMYAWNERASSWRFCGVAYPNRRETNVKSFGVSADTPLMIYLPLYNGVESLEIGVGSNDVIRPLPPRKSGVTKPVVFYGTSFTQGACASRPGMGFSAIATRWLDVPLVNLGFSGNGKMEMEMCEFLSEIDASCYVIHCLGNMSPALISERYEPFVRELRRRRPGVPIVFGEDCQLGGSSGKWKLVTELCAKLRAEDGEAWKDLYEVPATRLFPKDWEGSVDGGHPNDWGMMHVARGFASAIAEAMHLKWDGAPASWSSVNR